MTLLPILTLPACLGACLGYGAAVLRLLDRRPRRDPLQTVYALALGMGTLAYLVLAVGLAGFLRDWVLGGLIVLGWIPAARYWRSWQRTAREIPPRAVHSE